MEKQNNLLQHEKISIDEYQPIPSLLECLYENDGVPTSLSVEQVVELEKATRGQGDNPEWSRQRKGRCTASNCKAVCTRMATIRKKPDTNPKALVDRIIGVKQAPSGIPALEYGRQMEHIAVQKYKEIHGKTHTLRISECGLFVDAQMPYIGASPDRLVSCSCCGDGVLEVKCPSSCRDGERTVQEMPYLPLKAGHTTRVSLDKNHQYYYQVQAQMAVTGRLWTDFFVYSDNSYHWERIKFDDGFWAVIKETMSLFWLNHVHPAIMLTLTPAESRPPSAGALSLHAATSPPALSATTNPKKLLRESEVNLIRFSS